MNHSVVLDDILIVFDCILCLAAEVSRVYASGTNFFFSIGQHLISVFFLPDGRGSIVCRPYYVEINVRLPPILESLSNRLGDRECGCSAGISLASDWSHWAVGILEN